VHPPYLANHVHGDHPLHSLAAQNSRVGKTPGSVLGRHHTKKWLSFRSASTLQDEFVDHVERKTNVEVALIHLEKKPEGLEKLLNFMDGLKKGNNEYDEEKVSPEICRAIAIPTNFIQNTMHRFKAAVQAARVASEAKAVADSNAGSLGISLQEMQAKGVGNEFRETADESVLEVAREDFGKRYRDLKKRAWAQIIRSSLLTDKLSNQARRRLEAEAENIYQLEFTLANVHGFLQGVVESMGDIYKDMICGLFDNIMNRSNENVVFYKSWKSNEKHKKLGMRVKRSRFILPRFNSGYGGSIDYESTQFLSDIDKVFGYLDGLSGPYDGLANAFSVQKVENGERYSTRYFDFRFYKRAGTIHFYPKNMEVIERLNRFVGRVRNWIPTDWSEVNDDFKKQYDDGERLQELYTKEFSKSHLSRYSNVAYAMLGENRSDRAAELEKFSDAVEAAQEEAGIYAGPRLGYAQQDQLMLEAA
jgi:hypothetical protein